MPPGALSFASRTSAIVDRRPIVTLMLTSSKPRALAGWGMGRKTGPLRIVTLSAPDGLVRSFGCAVAFVVGAGLRRLVLPAALSSRLAPPATLIRYGALFIGVGLTSLALQEPVSAADMGDAVMIEGSGVLTTCRSWILFTSCTTHKVRLPERVAAGDKVILSYGSNQKNYTFEIALIRLVGDACTLMSESSRSDAEGEKIEVARCGPFPDATGQAR